ncbi:uncharacterized protein LOC127002632 [Eriocheir sinensis]|uniref:uncharacterized protein LOC127002632 n=1 Tax=Eriocheir sinensis TaxID=95602 RepID=UPI0021C649DA|nr:uncharacterized protein LOC127002632 [Eriocheir sinensis]
MASTRIFVTFLWLYTMVLTLGYSTNLTAFLMVPKAPAAIETIKDLYESGLEVAAIGDIYRTGIASASDPNLRGLLRVFRSYPSEREIFPRVLLGKAVFLQSRGFSEFHVITRYTTLGVPRMRFMRECFAPYSIAMALQRNSPLKRKFDEVIKWVVESGLLRRFFVDSLRLAATTKEYGGIKGESPPQNSVTALNMDHMQSVFLIAVLGWTAGMLSFGLEAARRMCR